MKRYSKIYGYLISDKLEDNDIITFGKHKGTKLKDIPKEYFIWLNVQPWLDKKLKDYIKVYLQK